MEVTGHGRKKIYDKAKVDVWTSLNDSPSLLGKVNRNEINSLTANIVWNDVLKGKNVNTNATAF